MVSCCYSRQELQGIRNQLKENEKILFLGRNELEHFQIATYRIVFCLDASFHQQFPHVFDECLHICPELFVIFLCIQSQIVANLRT